MSSDLPSIDPAVLAWGEYWYPIAWKGVLVSCSIAVLAALASSGFFLLLWRASIVKDHSIDWRTTALQAQTKTLNADVLRAGKDLEEANARVN